jgi:hypothetical protein
LFVLQKNEYLKTGAYGKFRKRILYGFAVQNEPSDLPGPPTVYFLLDKEPVSLQLEATRREGVAGQGKKCITGPRA